MNQKLSTPLIVSLTIGGVLLTGLTTYAIGRQASVRVVVSLNGVFLESSPRACIPNTSE